LTISGHRADRQPLVDFYDAGGRTNPSLDPEIRPLRLNPDEKRQIVSLLPALSGDVRYGRGSVR
jgi:hypothetical protein